MKLAAIVLKNLRLLLRSKGAAAVAIVGPLLIIVLVGLALDNTQRLDVIVGLVVPKDTALAQQYVQGLVDGGYTLRNFSAAEDCVGQIRQGAVHTCVVFPANFTVSNERQTELVAFVDTSRQNLVYAVINSLSSNVRSTSYDLSEDLAGTILGGLFSARAVLDEQAVSLGDARAYTDSGAATTGQLAERVGGIDLDYAALDFGGLESQALRVRASASTLREQGLALVKAGKAFAQLVEANSSVDTGDFRADLDILEERLEGDYNASEAEHAQLDAAMAALKVDIEALGGKIEAAKAGHAAIRTGLNELATAIAAVRASLSGAKAALALQRDAIDGIAVTNVESVVLPVKARVEPVVGEHTRLSFLFPYLLGLLIMFVGILLPATLIVLEKSSPAFFRTFTAPTRSGYHITATLLTAVLLLAFQVAVFLGLASYFLAGQVSGHMGITALALLLSMGVFVLIGMAIGYALGSQEAITLISISVGSVLLLLSDLVLPLETFGGLLRHLAAFNPYVLTTDVLRQLLLFSASGRDAGVLRGLGWLMAYAVLCAVLVVAIHKAVSLKFFRKHPASGIQKELASGRPLMLDEATVIRDKDDLLEALKLMSDATFAAHCYENRNEFTLWVRDALGERLLASRLANKGRAGMVAVLEDHLARERREFARRVRKNPEGGGEGNFY